MAISQDPRVPPATAMEAATREAFDLAPGPDARCFMCFKPVRHPAVFWQSDVRIWLHPDCALGLIAGLLADYRELRKLERLRDDLGDRGGR